MATKRSKPKDRAKRADDEPIPPPNKINPDDDDDFPPPMRRESWGSLKRRYR